MDKYHKYIKYKQKYLDLKQKVSMNMNMVGGGINFNIYHGRGICVNVNLLDQTQRELFEKLYTNDAIFKEDNELVIYDAYDKPGWVFLSAEDNKLKRYWDRFPKAINGKLKNNYGYQNIDITPLCIRIDEGTDYGDNEELKKRLIDQTLPKDIHERFKKELNYNVRLENDIVNEFLNNLNKVKDDEIKKEFANFINNNKQAIDVGEWLVFWYT
jgi:hypothetical protein